MVVNDTIERTTPGYNWRLNLDEGSFTRWGNTEEADPDLSPIGPEYLDVEVSTICHGVSGKLCSHCYTQNKPDGQNMSLGTFQALFDLVSGNLSVLHFNVGDMDANPDLGKMMKYALSFDVIPTLTVTGERKNDLILYDIVTYAGAVDVSCIDRDLCYNTIDKLGRTGANRINMKLMLSAETVPLCTNALSGVHIDSRLDKLNGVKIDLVRPVNRAAGYHAPTESQLRTILNLISIKRIPFAVSQCLGTQVLDLVEACYSDLRPLILEVEPCEAGLFKGYININGMYYPCPFAEFAGVQGVSILDKDNFVQQVWNGEENKEWQDQLLTIKRTCPLFI